MMIHLGKTKVLEGEVLEPLEDFLNAQPMLLQTLQEGENSLSFHGDPLVGL